MSLGPTFVKMADGKWYKNPVLYGNSSQWFLCFDEDDPPELVIHQPKEQFSKADRWELIDRLLANLGIISRILEHVPCGQRMFPPHYMEFKESIRAYLTIRQPIDLTNLMIKHDGAFDQMPDIEGCYMEF